jgi:hypothetical protein
LGIARTDARPPSQVSDCTDALTTRRGLCTRGGGCGEFGGITGILESALPLLKEKADIDVPRGMKEPAVAVRAVDRVDTLYEDAQASKREQDEE